MKRFVSLLVVAVLSFSLCISAFAIEPIPEFSSDFVRYAPSGSSSVFFGGESKSINTPWIVTPSTGYKHVSSLEASCNAIGDLHGHFTFVLIVGSRSNPAVYSQVRPVSIETIDHSTRLHYYDAYLRPTNFRYVYEHQTVTQGEIHYFNCIPFVVEFDVPEGQTFTSLYQTNTNEFLTVNGDYVTCAFFLYSASHNSTEEHLVQIEDYLSILPDYFAHWDSFFSNTDARVSGIYTFFSTLSSRFNASISRNATWDNMPDTPNPYNALADMLHAILNDKKNQAVRENQLSDLTDVQDSVISKASDNLPKFASGILNIFDFFDVTDSDFSFDIGNAFIGYEDYFGNVPFFFSSDIESRLEVQ